jgi:hypothetical protein
MTLNLKEYLDTVVIKNPNISNRDLYDKGKEWLRKAHLTSLEYDSATDELHDRIWGTKD